MNKYLAVSLSLTVAFIANSYAADSYYIEIGKPSSVEETHEQWRDLSAKYKSTLGKLKLFPKAVVNSQGENTNTIQAGPIAEKNKAQKICNLLFKADIPCFVIEGIEKAPPTMSIGMSQAVNQEAGQSFVISKEELNNDIGAAPTVAESPAVEPDNTQVSVHDVTGREQVENAEVDVAQAIPVPLTSDKNEEIKPVFSEEKTEAHLVVFNSDKPGRIIIETFSSEGAANKFWNYVNDNSPKLAKDLWVRVQRNLSASGNSGVQISVGVFADGDAAANFCNTTINAYDSRLRCRYEESREQAIKEETPPEERFSSNNYKHGNAYEERRRLLVRKVPSGQRALSRKRFVQPSDDSDKKFWAQIVIADSKAEATNRLEEIKNTNKDLVGDVGSSILSSISSHAKYTVRLGPIASEDEANTLCDNLQLRGVDCLLITTK